MLGDIETASDEPLYRVRRIELVIYDDEVWELVRDVEVLHGLMHELPFEDPRRWNVLRALEDALDATLDLQDVAGSAAAARAVLAPALAAPAVASAHRVSAVGHAHIDSAWLWPLRETVRKVGRTVANVTALMDDHPELVFAMSSAQQWEWMRDHRPDLWERMKEKVGTGQLVPVGGMWVESDTNMPGGEALARQLVHGKRFFLDELGVETDEVWLPDSFGYTAALPQLVHLSRSTWFLTQKISWSQFNKFPHHTFWWEGIDGSRVFTHFPPVDTYNSDLSGREMGRLVRNFQDKGRANRSLVPFGWGDGGGGPDAGDARPGRAAAGPRGLARVEIEPPAEFFAKALEDYPDAPVWVGELYLELHRGTYTSQAQEQAGQPARGEPAARGRAVERDGRGARRPRLPVRGPGPDLEDGAAAPVPRHPPRQLDRLGAPREPQDLPAALRGADRDHRGGAAGAGRQRRERRGELVFNAAPHERSGVAAGGAAPRAAADAPSRHRRRRRVRARQRPRQGTDRRCAGCWCRSSTRRPAGRRSPPAPPATCCRSTRTCPPTGTPGTSTTPTGASSPTSTAVESIEQVPGGVVGPAGVRDVDGRAECITSPRAPRVDCTAEVDWHETETFLKAAFPLDVRAERSTAETQFGYLHRPTHENTSWDLARFEICAHRFLHVTEPGYGVAVVNDSTYGHDVSRDVRPDGGTTTTVRLSLLRRAALPRPGDRPGRARAAVRAGARGATSVAPPARASASTCPSAACPAPRRSRRWSRRTTTAWWCRR